MQTRTDSFMEAFTNTLIGWFISLLTWQLVSWYMSIPVSFSQDLQITFLFTIVSVIRSYALRRAFNGKSVWSAIKGKFQC